MGPLPQALEIIFEAQMKRSNEKNRKKKNKLSNSQNMFFLLPLKKNWTPPTFKASNFLISCSF
jgi:hypothetical protein